MLDDALAHSVRANSTVRSSASLVGSDVVDHCGGCYKVFEHPDGRPAEVHQVLLVRRLDDDWVQLTLFNVDTGAIQDWQCGFFTPVYVLRRGVKL